MGIVFGNATLGIWVPPENILRHTTVIMRHHKGPGLWSLKLLNMQDKMGRDWFKPSKHEVIHWRWLKNIQRQYLQQNPTNSPSTNNCVFDTWKENARNAQWNTFKMKNVSNTDINKLNWRLHPHKGLSIIIMYSCDSRKPPNQVRNYYLWKLNLTIKY